MGSKLWRLLKILQIVSGDRRMKASEIARELGVSVRTFHRDRRVLEDAGLALTSDGDGYTLVDRPFLPAVHLTWNEGLALLCTVEGILETGVIPYRDSLEDALRKIRSGIPPMVRQRIAEAAEEISLKQEPMVDMSAHHDTFEVLWRAIQEHRLARISYLGRGHREPVERKIEPLAVIQRWRAWYAVAHCRLRNEMRTFRVDRIADISLSRERFVPSRDFNLNTFLRDAWMVERGQVHLVRIRFSGTAARLVRELTWHPTQQVEEDTEGSLIVSFRTGGLGEIADWVMGYVDEADVLEPEELREEIRGRARAIAAVYE
ncbi:MAG: WYL domain-containing protein [Bacillota bacterium]